MAEPGPQPAMGSGSGPPLPAEYGALSSGPPEPRPEAAPRRRQASDKATPRRPLRARRQGAPRSATPTPAVSPDPTVVFQPAAVPPPSRPAVGRTAAPAAPPLTAPLEPAGVPYAPDLVDPLGIMSEDAEPPARRSRRFRRRQKVNVVRGVRSRRLVRRVDVWTVLKVSFVFYVLVLVMVLLAVVALWNVAQALGVIHSLQKSIRTLFDLSSYTLHAGTVFKWTALGGGALTIVGTLLNVVAALMYNLISDVIGGIQVVVVSEPE